MSANEAEAEGQLIDRPSVAVGSFDASQYTSGKMS
jgi:hypothetical protein